jgi:hypothetical protein
MGKEKGRRREGVGEKGIRRKGKGGRRGQEGRGRRDRG